MAIELIKKIYRFFRIVKKATSIYNHKDVKIYKIYEEDNFSMPLIRDVFGNLNPIFIPYSCIIPPSYVAVINDGRCIAGREEVFSKKNECFKEITSQNENPAIGIQLPKSVKKVKGIVANLSLSGLENNYYHFCVEWMARFHLLKKSNIDIDFYIFSHLLPFQKQYLDVLKIDKKKIIILKEGTYIQADNLVVPSLINNWELVKFRGYQNYSKQWLPKWISEVYHDIKYSEIEDNGNEINKKRIYISRKLASYRHIENEEEILNILNKYDFSMYCLEEMTVKQKIKLFRNANFIISILGAGLVHMSFCKSICIIFELFTEYYLDPSYGLQAIVLGHQYNYMIGKTTITNNVPAQKENVYIDPLKFEEAINIIINNYKI